MGGSVCVKTMRGQRRRGKKEGHETDQECAVRLHTMITVTNHTRVYFGAGLSFSFSSFSYTRTKMKFIHRLFLCLFSEHEQHSISSITNECFFLVFDRYYYINGFDNEIFLMKKFN
jgi:hypothetical protein